MASGCGDVRCILLAHAIVRPRIDMATVRPWFQHCIPQILRLGIGETVGVAVPPERDEDAFRVKLNGLLRREPFHHFRWGARLRDDGIIVVRKLGTWATKKKSYETPTFTLPPANQPVYEEPATTEIAICLGCGGEFEPKGRVCCSVECSRKYRKIATIMARM